LDPEIKKGPWTLQEDMTLLAHIVENSGEKKWCKLVKILEGRTENAIKNRFQLIFTKLKKKKENKSKGEFELIEDYIKENGG
jgi:23S rRNA U2552 (ribose-2'-O)-methylase RlmE/FtsJ